jgi:PadR family transcriptional regulator PadR
MQTIITNLKRASVEIILLSLLCEEPMYGYQLAQEIKKRSNGQFSLMELIISYSDSILPETIH